MDKLQEIKLAVAEAKNLKDQYLLADEYVNDVSWLIEQLEQTLEENERLLQQNQQLAESLEAVFPYIGNIGDSSLIGSLKLHADKALTESQE